MVKLEDPKEEASSRSCGSQSLRKVKGPPHVPCPEGFPPRPACPPRRNLQRHALSANAPTTFPFGSISLAIFNDMRTFVHHCSTTLVSRFFFSFFARRQQPRWEHGHQSGNGDTRINQPLDCSGRLIHICYERYIDVDLGRGESRGDRGGEREM